MDSHLSLKLKQLKDQMQQQKKARTKRPQSSNKVIVADASEFLTTSELMGFDQSRPSTEPAIDRPSTAPESSAVLDFLREIGLERYWESFRAAQIDDVEVLAELTDEHLTSLGLPIGHRIKLLKRLREARTVVKPTTPPMPLQSRHDERKVRFEETEPNLGISGVRPRQVENAGKRTANDLMPSLTVQSIKPKPSSEKTQRAKAEDPKQAPSTAKQATRARAPQTAIETSKMKPTSRKQIVAVQRTLEINSTRVEAKPPKIEASQKSAAPPLKIEAPKIEAPQIETYSLPAQPRQATQTKVTSNEGASVRTVSRPASSSRSTEPDNQPQKPSTWLLMETSIEQYLCYECTALTQKAVIFGDRTFCSDECVNASKQGRMQCCNSCYRDFLSSCGVLKGDAWFCSQECSHRKTEVGSNTELHPPSTGPMSMQSVQAVVSEPEDEYIVSSLKPAKPKPSEVRLIFDDPVIAPRRPSEARIKKFMASTEKIEGW